jgi:TRAP-type C4-dicarboxylate transport system permease small subunit
MVHGVALRYLFGQPTIWQTEMSIYLLMFVAFVGAA